MSFWTKIFGHRKQEVIDTIANPYKLEPRKAVVILSDKDREQVCIDKSIGIPVNDITSKYNISRSTVYAIVKRANNCLQS